MKARPKTQTILEILNWKFVINLIPQQKWKASTTKDGYYLERDNVSMKMSKEEFEKYFKVVE